MCGIHPLLLIVNFRLKYRDTLKIEIKDVLVGLYLLTKAGTHWHHF